MAHRIPGLVGEALVLSALFFCLSLARAQQQPPVAWSAEFDSPADLARARMTYAGCWGNPVPQQEFAEPQVEHGILHLGLKFGAASPDLQAVCFSWGQGWGVPDPQPMSMPPIDIQKFPVLEVRWRMDKRFLTYDKLPGIDVYWRAVLADGRQVWGRKGGIDAEQAGDWYVMKVRFAPDSSIPGPLTPCQVTGIRLQAGSRLCKEPTWLDVDYIRARALTQEEAAAEKERVRLLGGYRPPELPQQLQNTFLYGVFGRVPFAGGWEGAFDDLVRSHMNYVLGVGFDPDDAIPPMYGWPGPAESRKNARTIREYGGGLRETAQAAERRGVYLSVIPPGSSTPEYLPYTLEREGPAGVEKAVEELATATRDIPNIVAWWFADEPLEAQLWGVAGTAQILEQRDPQRVAVFGANNSGTIDYYSRFHTVVQLDYYPLSDGRRDPWSVARVCREVAHISNRPLWFNPQAFGETDSWTNGLSYYCPTVEEFRLMMNLGLANGAKAFGIFISYWLTSKNLPGPWALFDLVGNRSVLMEEATRLGEKWVAIGPLLLQARPILDPAVTATAQAGPKHGLSVGAMGDPVEGPAFLMVVNEDLKAAQTARVTLPAAWTEPQRGVYDLYSLRGIAALGAKTFEVESLAPGEGRIYLLGTEAQFRAARQQILTNQVKEVLRVQGADRLIAERWGLGLSEYDGAVRRVRELLKAEQLDQALEAAKGAAARSLDATLASDAPLNAARRELQSARQDLGKLNLRIFSGADRIRSGQEKRAEPFMGLCRWYDALRRSYLLGQKRDLLQEINKLREEIQVLL